MQCLAKKISTFFTFTVSAEMNQTTHFSSSSGNEREKSEVKRLDKFMAHSTINRYHLKWPKE